MSFMTDVKTQFTSKPPPPTTSFAAKTIIVTGSNIGLGKEAVAHFVRLNATRVIMAVRSVAKGLAAMQEIETSTRRTGVIEVWECDYSRYDSVKAFAKRVAGLDRVDAVILNAGIATEKFERMEGEESTISVNVISTLLLAILVLEPLRESATRWGIEPVLSVVGSGVHGYTKMAAERKTRNIFDALNDAKKAKMMERYPVSKLLQLLSVRALASLTRSSDPFVTINTLNPGLCYTALTRHATGPTYVAMKLLRASMAWSAEEGSRTLVHAVTCGPESHGVYLSGAKVENNALAAFVTSDEGVATQKVVWDQLAQRLERIQPGIMATI